MSDQSRSQDVTSRIFSSRLPKFCRLPIRSTGDCKQDRFLRTRGRLHPLRSQTSVRPLEAIQQTHDQGDSQSIVSKFALQREVPRRYGLLKIIADELEQLSHVSFPRELRNTFASTSFPFTNVVLSRRGRRFESGRAHYSFCQSAARIVAETLRCRPPALPSSGGGFHTSRF